MKSDRYDTRGVFRSPVGAGSESEPVYGSDAGTVNQFPVARVRYLAEHLRTWGRLNIYILGAEWGIAPTEVVTWLTALHHEGLLERLEESPYFRVNGAEMNGGGE